MYSINSLKIKPRQLTVFLAKPNKTTIGKIKHIKDRELTVRQGKINEFSFTVPYYVDIDNELVRNPHIDKFKEKFFIKTKFNDKIEWFTISSISKKSDATDDLTVQCFSLGYLLRYKRVIDYDVTSYNCEMVTKDTLEDTGFTIGYINPEFNLKYRKFDVSSQTKLDFLYEIAETFEAIPVFDTVEMTVSFYKEEELSQNKGFNVGYGKYLQNFEEVIDSDEIVTRLHITGSDGLRMNAVNPTGKTYIDDFSYFLYPFEMDNNEKVVKSSDFMSDELSKAVIKYNAYVSSRKGEFAQLLENKKEVQKEISSQRITLSEEKLELTKTLDLIELAKKQNQSTSSLNARRSQNNDTVNRRKQSISNLESNIKSIDEKIKQLGFDLEMSNHLSKDLMEELNGFIQEDEWSDENKIDENDLYESGLEKIKEINSPPINISLGIVNFFEMVSEQHNWDRFGLGDIIRINHKKIGSDIKTKLVEIKYSFDSASINIVVSNDKDVQSDMDRIKQAFYTIDKINTDYNKRKINWNTSAYNFNLRNDRITETPVNPIIDSSAIEHGDNDDGSVNLTLKWGYPNWEKTEENEHSIDGFVIYLHSDEVNDKYQFGSEMANETKVDVAYDKRIYTFPSVPANLYYTIGIQAYRRVDEDINRDGIILSDIVPFNKSNKPLINNLSTRSLLSSDTESSLLSTNYIVTPSEPYKPKNVVNLIGKLNNSKYTVLDTEPENPEMNDIWLNTTDKKVYIYDGQWRRNTDIEDSMDYTDKTGNRLDDLIIKTEEEIRADVEAGLAEVDAAMKIVDAEVDRIRDEVIPRVQAEVDRINIEVVPRIDAMLDNLHNVIVPRIDAELDRIHNEVVPRIDAVLDNINNVIVPRIDAELDRIDTVVVPRIDSILDNINNTIVPRIDAELDRIDTIVVPNINSELDRIENQVIPHVEQVIRDTYVPKQNTPPDPVNGSGLWWDTTQSPPRFKRYNPTTKQWENVAYTEDEIDGIIVDTRNSIEDNVITSINVSPEDIVIKTNKLDVYGVVTFINSDKTSMTLIDGGKIITGTITSGQIDTDELFANSAVIGIIQAGIVQTSELNASKITTGTLDAKLITVKDLSASSITTGILDALKVTVKDLSASSITTGVLDAKLISVLDLSASSITTGILDALKVTVKNLSASSIIAGTLDAKLVNVLDLNAASITTGVLDAKKITVLDLSASSITSGTLDAKLINVLDLNAGSITSGILDAKKISVLDLSADSLTSGTLDALKVTVANLSALSIISGTLDASKVNIANLNASSIITGELKGIDITGVNIQGSRFYSALDSNTYTLIENSYLESRGIYTREWRGDTTTNNVALRFEKGYIRAKNDTQGWSLYYADFGISTYADGAGGDMASGSIIFRDHSYSTANSLLIHSFNGVVAMRSEYNRVILDANASINLDSDESSIYLRPMKKTRSGTNEFLFRVKDNASWEDTDGWISYGDVTTSTYHSGLRFSKYSGGYRIYATNGNGDVGTGDFHAKEFITASLEEYKTNIVEWKESALDLINSATIYDYVLKEDLKNNKNKRRQGLVIGNKRNTPANIINKDGVEQYMMNSWSWKAIQELSEKVDRLERENIELKKLVRN